MSIFKFKHFQVKQSDSAMKIGTDAMIFGALIDPTGKKSALDIGTGTGVLSLMIAQKNSELKIQSIEIEEKAALEAQGNFNNSAFSSQIRLIREDFLSFNPGNSYDLIFSNPPYFENSSKSTAETRNFARHDDSLPLSLLFSKTSTLLSELGHFWLILPHLTMDQYYSQAASFDLFPELEISVFGKENQLTRKVTCFSKSMNEKIEKQLIVRNADGTYTKEYKQLTEDYHFNQLK